MCAIFRFSHGKESGKLWKRVDEMKKRDDDASRHAHFRIGLNFSGILRAGSRQLCKRKNWFNEAF